MKKFTLSVAAVMAMSTFAMAGGDIAPVVEAEEVVAPIADDSGFYLGLAYSMANYTGDDDGYYVESGPLIELSGTYEQDYDATMLQAGYKINKYFSVEGRYWHSFGDADYSYNGTWVVDGVFDHDDDYSGSSSDYEFKAWGLYIKPMYPVTDALDVYALLGYGNVTLSDEFGDWLNEDGFQWGLGASYEFTNNLSVFADYVQIQDDADFSEVYGEGWFKKDFLVYTIYTVNIGLSYRF